MTEIWTMGEMIVEIMREKENEPLDKAGVFRGPYPSGAPAIFIDRIQWRDSDIKAELSEE